MRQPPRQIERQLWKLIPIQVRVFGKMFQLQSNLYQAIQELPERPLMLMDPQFIFRRV